jgi:hypothetical protein
MRAPRFAGVVLLLALAFIARADEPLAVRAEQFAEAYEENEVAADAIYKDKLVRIDGRVKSVSRRDGVPCINLETGDKSAIPQIECLVRSGEPEGWIQKLKRGSRARMVCTGAGKNVFYLAMVECSQAK